MKPILQTLNNQAPAKVPFWFMRQAGRYLPEYRKLRAEKGGFLAMAFDPNAACEITMQPIRRFSMDAAIIFSDILTIPMALGQHLEFMQGEGPKLGDLDINALEFQGDTLNPVYEAINKTRNALQEEGFDNTALIGFAGAPWTVATYMVEGGGSKTFGKIKTLSYQNPEHFQKLIDIITDSTITYLLKQIEAGAEVVKIFDSWASALDAEGFQKYCIAPIKKITSAIKLKYPDIPVIGFAKGAGTHTIDFAKQTGINAIQIGFDTHPTWAAENLQPLLPVQGNLDPFCLKAGGKALDNSAKTILDALADKPFIFNLGHGIDKDTPIENVERLVKIIKDYK